MLHNKELDLGETTMNSRQEIKLNNPLGTLKNYYVLTS